MRKIINKILLILLVISAISCEVENDFEFDEIKMLFHSTKLRLQKLLCPI